MVGAPFAVLQIFGFDLEPAIRQKFTKYSWSLHPLRLSWAVVK